MDGYPMPGPPRFDSVPHQQMKNQETWRIELSYACYAVEVAAGVIVDAAPIAKWAVGKQISWFVRWVERKGGTAKRLADLI